MKPKIRTNLWAAILGAVGGAVVAVVIGFGWGGWMTTGVSQNLTDAALMTSRAAICVAQFMKDPNHQEKLDELKKANRWERPEIIEKGGWDKMPGQQESVYLVSRACANGLELLMEK